MALVLPLLLLVLFAIIDFGRLLNAQIVLTEAAREGARAEALGADPTARAAGAAIGIRPVIVTVTQSCPDVADPTADARVDVSHHFEFVTPVGALASLFTSGELAGPITVTGKGIMSCAH
jgi:hypothetical protein